MYEEGNKHLSFKSGSLILKIMIGAVILILLAWLIAKGINKANNKNTLASNGDYVTNITSMKDAAIEYYNSDRLPQKVGESKKLTLGEMINQKMIIDFSEDGKKCNKDESYVQVTKTADENHALKVSLTCNDKTDFITTTIENKKNNTPVVTDLIVDDNKPVNTKPSTTTSSSSNSSSSKKTTTEVTTKTTVNISFEGCTTCCLDCNSNTRYYKLVKWSNWEDGYSNELNAENKKVTTESNKYCKQVNTDLVTTSYTQNTKSHSYSYELQLLDVKPSNVHDTVSISETSHLRSTSDYEIWYNYRNNKPIYQTNNRNERNVMPLSIDAYKNSSLKIGNFTYSFSNPYLSDRIYRTKVTVYVNNANGIKAYHDNKLNANVYFVPIKFRVSYTSNDCVWDSESNFAKYNGYKVVETKKTEKWIHRVPTYKWSTNKNLSGWEYTGTYEDR